MLGLNSDGYLCATTPYPHIHLGLRTPACMSIDYMIPMDNHVYHIDAPRQTTSGRCDCATAKTNSSCTCGKFVHWSIWCLESTTGSRAVYSLTCVDIIFRQAQHRNANVHLNRLLLPNNDARCGIFAWRVLVNVFFTKVRCRYLSSNEFVNYNILLIIIELDMTWYLHFICVILLYLKHWNTTQDDVICELELQFRFEKWF